MSKVIYPAKSLMLSGLILLCFGLPAAAQNAGNIWYFGNYAGLDFNTTPPTALSNGALMTTEGCSSIADPATGQVLFYTDGITVWDKTHTAMLGSVVTPLNGDPSSTQSGVIVPKPGDPTKFYIFSTPAQVGASFSTSGSVALCYSLVDMTLNGGLGDLTSVNIPLMDSTTEKIASVGLCDGSYWVVGHRWNCDTFYAFHLTAAGLSAPVKSKTGMVHFNAGLSTYNEESIGYLKFSSDATRLASVVWAALNTVETYTFNPATGQISLLFSDPYGVDPFNTYYGPYGCSFSPDNSRLYVGTLGAPNTIYQYDMTAATPAAMVASKTVVAEDYVSSGFGALQNGPDGKMYITKGAAALDIIASPNSLGTACGYVPSGIALAPGTYSSFGLPTIVESFLSGTFSPPFVAPAQTSLCLGDTAFASTAGLAIQSISPAASTYTNAGAATVAFFPTATTEYTVITGGGGCSAEPDTVVFTLTVNVAAPMFDLPVLLPICQGDTLYAPQNPDNQFAISPMTGVFINADSTLVSFAPQVTTTYQVSPLSACSADAPVSFTVVVKPAPPKFQAPATSQICAGDSVHAPQSAGVSFAIFPATGFTINADSTLVIFQPSATTAYTIVSNDTCRGNDTQYYTLTVLPYPDAAFTITPVTGNLGDVQALLCTNGSTNATSYAWYRQDTLLSEAAALTATAGPGRNCIVLYAFNALGCADSAEQCVDVAEIAIGILIPNAFTPDGDGLNDRFHIGGTIRTISSFRIFNRFGEEVFTTSDVAKGWDGVYNGQPCDVGTYWYLIQYKDSRGRDAMLKGDVLLIR